MHLIADAQEDLGDIYEYVARSDSLAKVDQLHASLLSLCKQVEKFPKRGHVTPELKLLGVVNFRELHFKTYRIIYQIIDRDIFIHCIIDGRRDMENLLRERLLRR